MAAEVTVKKTGCAAIDAFSSWLDAQRADWAERDEEIRLMEEERDRREKEERYRTKVPRRYWNENLGTFTTGSEERLDGRKTAERFARAVKHGDFRTLVLLGSVGTGKTHLACGIIYECGGLYRLAPALVEEIRRARSFSAKETESYILGFYGDANLLVVDEIGRGVAAADEQYMLYQIINERYNRRKPTVLISNQSKKDFLNYVGIAAADRLTESAQVVEFTGPSYRTTLRRDCPS